LTAKLIAAVIFGAISGSSTAMAAAISVIAYPELIKRGYPKWMAAGVIASAGGYRTADSAKYYTDSVRCNCGGVHRFFVFCRRNPGDYAGFK